MRDRLRSTIDTTMAPRMSTRLLFSVEEYKRPVAATRRESDGDKNLIRGWRSAFRGTAWSLEQAVGLGESNREPRQSLLTICASFNKLSPVVKPKVPVCAFVEQDRRRSRKRTSSATSEIVGIFHTRYGAYTVPRKTWDKAGLRMLFAEILDNFLVAEAKTGTWLRSYLVSEIEGF